MPTAVLQGAILAGADGLPTERNGRAVPPGVDQCGPVQVCAIADQPDPEDGRARRSDELHDWERCKNP